jgi:hypothetical protein
MGNRFTAHGSSADRDELHLTNGHTDVFFDVLTLAGCDLAKTEWEQNLVLYFADAHRLGMGTASFDLSEIPWTANWRAEKDFFLRMIDTAASRHGWDRLSYDPPYVANRLAIYRAMVAGFVPVPVAAPGLPFCRKVLAVPGLPVWRTAPGEELLARCGRHDIYQGELGCRLCDP